MSKRQFAFGKINFILLGIAALIITIGFLLMTGAKTTEESGFDPAIFDTQRIVIAPTLAMIGFVLVIFAILKKSKDKEEGEQ